MNASYKNNQVGQELKYFIQVFHFFSLQYFLNPLKKFFSPAEIDKIFVNIPVSFNYFPVSFLYDIKVNCLHPVFWSFLSLLQDLVKVHKSLMADVQDSILNKNALNLYQIFINYKERYSWTYCVIFMKGSYHPIGLICNQ